MLEDQLAEADAQMAKAKTSGNTTQIAVARARRQVFEKALEEFKTSGTVTFPQKVRREIQDIVDNARADLTALSARRKTAAADAESSAVSRLMAILAEQGTPVTESVARSLLPFLGAAVSTPTASVPAQTSAPSSGAPASSAPTQSVPAVSSTGSATAETEVGCSSPASDWTPLCSIGVLCDELEIVNIGIADITAPKAYTEDAMASSSPIQIKINPFKAIQKNSAAVAVRALSVVGRQTPEIMTWPSPSNGWNIELRCRPAFNNPAPFGLKLEVSAAGASFGIAKSAAESGPASAPVRNEPQVGVSVFSTPPGASVVIDGVELKSSAGKPLVTPCDIRIYQSGSDVVLRKRGYLDANLGKIVPKAGDEIKASLTPSPTFVDKQIQIKALIAGGPTGIRLRQGQTVHIKADGKWACGKGGEMTGPEGYGRNFPQYSRAPRITMAAPYGALIMRIGGTGKWTPVGKLLSFEASESGILQFDINEDNTARRDNKGSMNIRIMAE